VSFFDTRVHGPYPRPVDTNGPWTRGQSFIKMYLINERQAAVSTDVSVNAAGTEAA